MKQRIRFFCIYRGLKVKELIKELINYDMNQEIEIYCYTSIGDENDMVIYSNIVDKNGNIPCQVRKEITNVRLEKDGKIVAIS